jgi:hypothetical protein
MEYLEYTAFTKGDCSLAWKLFSDFRFWPSFFDVYGDIRWSKGAPWTAGSRMQIQIVRPVKATVDHVITACAPGKHVAWIDHFLGITMEQWVTFDALSDGRTRVYTWLEATGSTRGLEGRDLRKFLRAFIHVWYSSFCEACDRLSEGQMVCS